MPRVQAGRAAAMDRPPASVTAIPPPSAPRRVNGVIGGLELVAQADVDLPAGVHVLLGALALRRDPAVVELVRQVDALDRGGQLLGDLIAGRGVNVEGR